MRAVLRCLVAGLMLSGPLAAQAQPPAAPHQHGAAQAPTPPPTPASTEDHSAHQAPATRPAAVELPAFIPPLTDADRAAAFPDVTGHSVHDNAVNYFVLFDQLEWQTGDGLGGFSWDTRGWVGQDRNRLCFAPKGSARAAVSTRRRRTCSTDAPSRGGGT